MEHTIATIFLPKSYCQTYIPDTPGFGFVFQQDGALAHRARDTVAFLERKVPDLFLKLSMVPEFTGSEPRRLMQEKVYQSRIANVNELEMRLLAEWGRLDQSIVDAAIAASGAVVS